MRHFHHQFNRENRRGFGERLDEVLDRCGQGGLLATGLTLICIGCSLLIFVAVTAIPRARHQHGHVLLHTPVTTPPSRAFKSSADSDWQSDWRSNTGGGRDSWGWSDSPAPPDAALDEVLRQTEEYRKVIANQPPRPPRRPAQQTQAAAGAGASSGGANGSKITDQSSWLLQLGAQLAAKDAETDGKADLGLLQGLVKSQSVSDLQTLLTALKVEAQAAVTRTQANLEMKKMLVKAIEGRLGSLKPPPRPPAPPPPPQRLRATPPALDAPPPNTSYYQGELISSLLHVEAAPEHSRHISSLNYHRATVDEKALSRYLAKHNMSLPADWDLLSLVERVNTSCFDLARAQLKESFHESMLVRKRPLPRDLPGGVQRAAWRWPGRISRAVWEAVPRQLRGLGGERACAHCTSVLKYKVLNGTLLRAKDNEGTWVADIINEMLLVTVHLYDVPDLDVLVHWGDGATAGIPVLGFNIDMSHPAAGFTFPYWEHWRDHAMSLQQSVGWAACTCARYPRDTAVPRAVWRGSTSDPAVNEVTVAQLRALPRFRLHMLTDVMPHILDARITKVIQTRNEHKCPRPSWGSDPSSSGDYSPCAREAKQQEALIATILGLPNSTTSSGNLASGALPSSSPSTTQVAADIQDILAVLLGKESSMAPSQLGERLGRTSTTETSDGRSGMERAADARDQEQAASRASAASSKLRGTAVTADGQDVEQEHNPKGTAADVTTDSSITARDTAQAKPKAARSRSDQAVKVEVGKLQAPHHEEPDAGPWFMAEEAFQQYAVVLDIDGNSWSSRYFLLTQHTTAPVLKQASPLWAWYEHLLPPGHSYSRDLHDVSDTAAALLSDMGYDVASYWAEHGRLAVFAPNRTAPKAYFEKHAKDLAELAARQPPPKSEWGGFSDKKWGDWEHEWRQQGESGQGAGEQGNKDRKESKDSKASRDSKRSTLGGGSTFPEGGATSTQAKLHAALGVPSDAGTQGAQHQHPGTKTKSGHKSGAASKSHTSGTKGQASSRRSARSTNLRGGQADTAATTSHASAAAAALSEGTDAHTSRAKMHRTKAKAGSNRYAVGRRLTMAGGDKQLGEDDLGFGRSEVDEALELDTAAATDGDTGADATQAAGHTGKLNEVTVAVADATDAADNTRTAGTGEALAGDSSHLDMVADKRADVTSDTVATDQSTLDLFQGVAAGDGAVAAKGASADAAQGGQVVTSGAGEQDNHTGAGSHKGAHLKSVTGRAKQAGIRTASSAAAKRTRTSGTRAVRKDASGGATSAVGTSQSTAAATAGLGNTVNGLDAAVGAATSTGAVTNGGGIDAADTGTGAVPDLESSKVVTMSADVQEADKERSHWVTSNEAEASAAVAYTRELNKAAAVLLNKWSMVEAIAYTLGVYADLTEWMPTQDDAYSPVSFSGSSTPWLPQELKEQITSSTHSSNKWGWDDDWGDDDWWWDKGKDSKQSSQGEGMGKAPDWHKSWEEEERRWKQERGKMDGQNDLYFDDEVWGEERGMGRSKTKGPAGAGGAAGGWDAGGAGADQGQDRKPDGIKQDGVSSTAGGESSRKSSSWWSSLFGHGEQKGEAASQDAKGSATNKDQTAAGAEAQGMGGKDHGLGADAKDGDMGGGGGKDWYDDNLMDYSDARGRGP